MQPPPSVHDPSSPTRGHAATALPLTRHRFGEFEFDTARRELRRSGVPVEMPARAFECIEHLLAHRDRAVDRDELAHAVFGRTDVSDGQLAQVVVRARRCLDDDGQRQRIIRTVPRYGFRWVAETMAMVDDAATPAGADARGPEVALQGAPQRPLPQPDTAAVVAALPHERGWRIAGISLLIAATVAAAAWMLPQWRTEEAARAQPATAMASQATLVLPTRVTGADDAAWVRLGLMDFLAERMRLSGLSVPPSENTLALLGPEPGTADHARLRSGSGAALIVTSRAQRTAQGWRVDLQADGGDGMRHRANAVDADLLQAARQACDRLLATLGRVAPAGNAGTRDLDERLQRVNAAMLANELDTARSILLQASPEQLTRPQLRYRLAQIDYRAGDFVAAGRALDDLLAGPEAAADPLFRTRLLIYRGGTRVRRNELFEAERDYDAALEALQIRDAGLERGQVLNGRAIARAGLGREDEAIADFGAARTHLQRAGDRLGVARVDANLGALELERGHPGQALDYLASALAVYEDSADVNALQVTRSALSAVHLQRLDARAALASNDEALRLLPRTPDPTLRLAAHLDRANALIALGRFSEARRVLEHPTIAAATTPPYEQRRVQTQLELAWRTGQADAAVALADAALADWPRLPGDTLRDWIGLRREQAARAADLPRDGATAIDATAGSTVPALLATALVRGEDADAEAPLREALALAERRGAPAEIVEAVAVYAPWLIRHDRLQEAGALVGRIAPWADRSYDGALLQWQLADALGDRDMANRARQAVVRLAGERPPPADPVSQAPRVMRR